MSLVDYASSSEDEAPDFVEEPQLPQDKPPAQASASTSEPPPPRTQYKKYTRSNVVTEDISKLFVEKPSKPSSAH